MKINEKTNTAIRERAYHIWENAGRPDGRADEHWHQATQEVFASPPMTTPEKPKPKKAPAKTAATTAKKAPAKATTAAKKAVTETKRAPAKKKATAK